MLEKFDVKLKIDELKKRFEDLTEAHQAIQTAREQLNKLSPLVERANEFEKVSKELDSLNNSIEAIPAFFANKELFY